MSHSLINPKGIYPIISVLSNLFTLSIGLLFVKETWFPIFLVCILCVQFIFGYWKTFFRAFPILFIFILISGLSTWLFSGSEKIMEVSGRIALFGISALTTLGMNPVDLVRNMNQLKLPRSLSAGFLVSLRFVSVLAGELRIILKAIKTRNLHPFRNPKIWYRAILFPFIIRLLSISDTLSASLETRAFDIHNSRYSIYKPLTLKLRDIMYLILLIAILLLGLYKKIGGR